jgi:hypothetical protein
MFFPEGRAGAWMLPMDHWNERPRFEDMREPMKKGMLPVLSLAFVLLSGPGLAAGHGSESARGEESPSPGSSEEVIITLQAPLGSPLFSQTPVAVVDDEVITFSDLAESISSTHAGRAEEATGVKKDYASLLERIVTRRLIVQEARNIGLDELSGIASQIDAFSTKLLLSRLMAQQLKTVEPDPAEVDELYRRMSREFLLTTLQFGNEEDAVAFAEECQSGDDFDALAGPFVEDGRAEGEIGGQEYLKLKDLLPRVAEAAFDMEVDSVSEIFTVGGGFLLFHIKDARFYEDPELKEEARQRIVQPLRREKAYEYGEFLEGKYATIDKKLLEEADFEAEKSGVLWFKKEKPVDFQELLDDERILATVRGDELFTLTVGDLAREVERTYFHGVEKALERKKGLNEKKRILLKNILLEKTARLEAVDQGIDQTEEYLDAVEEYTNSLIFDAFVKRVIAPDIEISEGEVRQYYEEHPTELSSPKMLRLDSLIFSTLPDAEGALRKLRSGADFKWVSANSPGQVDRDAEGISAFDNQLLSLTGLPEDLRKAAEGAERGDFLLYSDPESYHHVIVVEKVFPATRQDYVATRGKIAQAIFEEKAKALIDDWSEKLKEAYETRIFVTGLGD